MHPVTWGASQIFGGFRLTGGDFSLVIEKDALYGQQFGIHPGGWRSLHFQGGEGQMGDAVMVLGRPGQVQGLPLQGV